VGINTYNEKPLHAALKDHYLGLGGSLEVPVGRFVADCVQDGVLIEIQTASFGAMRRKLEALVADHPVRLVYPVAAQKWIVRVDDSGRALGRRKSPKRGRWEEVFKELVAFPSLMLRYNFTLVVVMVLEEEVRIVGGKRRRRRRDWSRSERRLLAVVGERTFAAPGDFLRDLSAGLPTPFTTADLARCSSIPRWLSQKMAYCLREMGVIMAVGKTRAGVQYVRTDPLAASRGSRLA
jgi:hypothetical protein